MEYNFKNEFGEFFIRKLDEDYFVYGSIKAAEKAFREIHRMPPNKHGNFYGREKSGATACMELIERRTNNAEKRNEAV